MAMVNFLKHSERKDFLDFMEKLKNERRIKYVSRLQFLSVPSQDHTGVYVMDNGQVITVFVEKGKPNSRKTISTA